jgi:hypothetical protein
VTAVTKPLLFATVAVAAFVLVYPAVRERLPSAVHLVRSTTPAAAQSESQLSSEEFAQVTADFTPERLRSFAGEPATTTEASVEGVRLECWYYGVAGARGAYQICFQNGRLSAKARFG